MKPFAKRYYRKRVNLFRLIDKVKLWPSRRGVLHGIKSIEYHGNHGQITTHCGKAFMVADSCNSRAARCLRNKVYASICTQCSVPDWKIEKFAATRFNRHFGSALLTSEELKLTTEG
jgi:pyrrolysyl-tRNA synthetase-like protein